MDKITRLKKEIEELERQKQAAKEFIKQAEDKCKQNYQDMADAYREFYENKRNKEFVLYDRFPSVEALELYAHRYESFPLHHYGTLNVKELAEIIKHCYQFQTGKEYDIYTIGTTEDYGEPVYGGQAYTIKPHLFFMIGNENTLSPFEEFNGKFTNDDRLYSKIYLNARGKDIINIELKRAWFGEPFLDIDCLTHTIFDKVESINYYDLEHREYDAFKVSRYKNVFSSNIRGKLRSSSNKVKGIKDVFDFDIDYMDSFIARVLISIIIYKRNNNITELTDYDYNHIFRVLFGERVNITASAQQDIPKHLIYVPNKNYNK